MRNCTDDGDNPSVAEEIARALRPAMVFMGALIVLGAAGNLLVCYVFFCQLRMTNQDRLISALSVFGIVTCVIAMPTEIVDLIYFLTYDSETSCRFLKLINHFCVFSSILMLVAIAFNRYRMVCHPFKPQLTVKNVQQMVLLCTVMALVTAVPSATVYGIRTSNVTGLSEPAHDCSISDSMYKTVYPTIYNGFLNVMFFLCMITLAAAYIQILRAIKRHKLQMKKYHKAIRTGSSPCESPLTTSLERSRTGPVQRNRIVASDPEFKATQRKISHKLSAILSETYVSDTGGQDLLAKHSEGRIPPTDNTSPRKCQPPCFGIRVGDETEDFPETVIKVSISGTEITETLDKVKDLSPEVSSSSSSTGSSAALAGSSTGCNPLDSYRESVKEMVNRSIDPQTLPVEPPEKAGKNKNTNVNAQDKPNSEAYVPASGSTASPCTQTVPAESTADRKPYATFPKCLLCIKTISDRLFWRSRTPEVVMSSPRMTVDSVSIGKTGRRVANDTNINKRRLVTVAHKKFKAKVESRKATILGIAITVGFFLSSTPHLILIAIRNLNPGYDRSLRGVELTFYNIFLRSYYFHAVANPVIYGVFNNRFRKSCIQLFRHFQYCIKWNRDRTSDT